MNQRDSVKWSVVVSITFMMPQKMDGQMVYVRLVDVTGKIHCSLVIAKSFVTPIKYTLIPRLELAAAVLSSKMSAIIRKELQYEDMAEYYWTDSQVVVGYLRNAQK